MFSVLGGLIAVPAITATTEAVRQGQRQNAREQHRGRKSNLVVNLPFKNMWSSKFDGSLIILKNNKLYVDTAANALGASHAGHPFAGYYLPHPNNQSKWKGAGWKGEGMVSTISDDPPYLNWIYVDRFTHEVKYGNKIEAEGEYLGPWDCTEIDHRVTFEGWEGFMAVQENEEDDMWALYFDVKDDWLTTEETMVGNLGKRKLQVQLSRREMPKTKAAEEEEREERRLRIEAKAMKAAERQREKELPVQDVFRKRESEPNNDEDDEDVRVRYEEEIDE